MQRTTGKPLIGNVPIEFRHPEREGWPTPGAAAKPLDLLAQISKHCLLPGTLHTLPKSLLFVSMFLLCSRSPQSQTVANGLARLWI